MQISYKLASECDFGANLASFWVQKIIKIESWRRGFEANGNQVTIKSIENVYKKRKWDLDGSWTDLGRILDGSWKRSGSDQEGDRRRQACPGTV